VNQTKLFQFLIESISREENTDFETNQISNIEKPQIYEKPLISENSNEEKISKEFNFKPNKKILLAIASIILAFILIGVIIDNDGIQPSNNSEPIPSKTLPDFSLQIDNSNSEPIPSKTLPDFSLQIDNSKYDASDIISISGKTSSSSTGTARLFIENEKNKLIWAEIVNLKNNGEFSTLLIAGGIGWENSGKYFLNVEHNDFTKKISFDFIGK
jgi:hypothetical protein